MSVPTGGINKYTASNSEASLFELIREKCAGYDPLILFLLGYNYFKFEEDYNEKSFFKLGEILQNKIGKGLLNEAELKRTYKELLKQDSLSGVLKLAWFRRHKKKFEEENEEVSLMIPRKEYSNEENKQVKMEKIDQPPAFLMEKEEDMESAFKEEVQPVAQMEKEENPFESDTYQQLVEQQAEADRRRRQEEEAESERLIKQMLEEEKNQEKQRREEQERKSLLEAQKIQKQLEEEHNKQREEEEEKNKPECKICYDAIEFSDIVVLGCSHIYHPNCMKFHIKAKVDDKSFPVTCPEPNCGIELLEQELQIFCDGDLYEKMQKFQFELFLEQNNQMFNHCPTPDCKFVFEWDGNKEDQQFDCKFCKKTYCIMCRVDWHEGLSCKEYRELNGYPPEDRAFYKMLKGTNFKQCPKCKFWVEKSEGCDHMTCRCKYEFCYRCGGKYRACNC